VRSSLLLFGRGRLVSGSGLSGLGFASVWCRKEKQKEHFGLRDVFGMIHKLYAIANTRLSSRLACIGRGLVGNDERGS
jgi:hypothetical protein